jgi:hypothetical protein
MESKNHKLREVQKSIWELVDSEILTWTEAKEITSLLQVKKIDILA